MRPPHLSASSPCVCVRVPTDLPQGGWPPRQPLGVGANSLAKQAWLSSCSFLPFLGQPRALDFRFWWKLAFLFLFFLFFCPLEWTNPSEGAFTPGDGIVMFEGDGVTFSVFFFPPPLVYVCVHVSWQPGMCVSVRTMACLTAPPLPLSHLLLRRPASLISSRESHDSQKKVLISLRSENFIVALQRN